MQTLFVFKVFYFGSRQFILIPTTREGGQKAEAEAEDHKDHDTSIGDGDKEEDHKDHDASNRDDADGDPSHGEDHDLDVSRGEDRDLDVSRGEEGEVDPALASWRNHH